MSRGCGDAELWRCKGAGESSIEGLAEERSASGEGLVVMECGAGGAIGSGWGLVSLTKPSGF